MTTSQYPALFERHSAATNPKSLITFSIMVYSGRGLGHVMILGFCSVSVVGVVCGLGSGVLVLLFLFGLRKLGSMGNNKVLIKRVKLG
ncbi:MAG: hypothetical protein IPG29_03740 [Sphingobacteriales bacterium]|nr:hypothetical protein [Sphingobacteriales bacterium]